jgi:thermostable 8-oxoguanine DNA glycosylase
MANDTQWDNDVDKVIFQKEMGDRTLEEVYPVGRDLYTALQEKPELFNNLPKPQQEIILNIQRADAHLRDAQQSVTSLFSKAYEFGSEEQKEKLKEIGRRFSKNLIGIDVEDPNKLTKEQQQKALKNQLDLQNRSKALQLFAEDLREVNPNMLQRVEDFSLDKASETFANVALHAYDKYGEKAPTVSIENLYQGMGFSQSEDLNKLLKETKGKFANRLAEKGMSVSKAQKAADKIIGMTFDMGHANISKKHGFKDEDIINEAKALAKHVKHLHVTDNFGYSDSHLPPGMGNVPVREVLEEMEKAGVKASKINEVGGWFEHFKTSPFNYILESMGAPIYSSGQGPYWSQATGFQQGYAGGYGEMLPSINYQTFGAGFSQLPSELGGSVGGGNSGRFSGRGME